MPTSTGSPVDGCDSSTSMDEAGARSTQATRRVWSPDLILLGAYLFTMPIQIEVETLPQLAEALEAGATSVLLDNFSLEMMREAVALTAGRALLEASGGINHESIVAIAETGVDRISIGSLTKDVKATDYSLRIVE